MFKWLKVIGVSIIADKRDIVNEAQPFDQRTATCGKSKAPPKSNREYVF